MPRASIGERKSQALRSIPEKAPKLVLRAIDGGVSSVPMWQELLGLLLFLFAHRKKKVEVVTLPEMEATPAFFDDVPDTGVREILREEMIVPRPEKPRRKPKRRIKSEEVRLTRVTKHALAQFVRAYMHGTGTLRSYIDERIKKAYGPHRVAEFSYEERSEARLKERRGLEAYFLRVLNEVTRPLRATQEREEEGTEVLHLAYGPSKSFFARFDAKTGTVLGFYGSEGFNRHRAYRRSRVLSHEEAVRRH